MKLLLAPARDVLGALMIGLGMALALLWFTRRNTSLTYHFSSLIITLLLIAGTCRALQLPGFLSSMVLGFIVSNYSSKKHILLKSFANIEPGIYVLFFVLAGTHIDFSMVQAAGIAGAAFVLARAIGIGEGLAVPHAMIEGGPKIRGVIGISHKGIDYEAIDGKPVYLIVLIATPEAHYDQHLHALAAIAKIFGQDPEIKNRIIKARTAAEVHEILQTGHADAVNVYLQE